MGEALKRGGPQGKALCHETHCKTVCSRLPPQGNGGLSSLVLAHMIRTHHKPSAWRPWLAGLMASVVLALGFFAASPSLHRLIHPEMGHGSHAHHGHCHDHGDQKGPEDQDHHCVITLFAHGAVLSAAADVAVIEITSASIVRISPSACVVHFRQAELLPPACGPPVLPA
jgi:hypothetical protein